MNESSKRIAALIQQGKKIEAIKVLREATGVSLKEAKEEIERLMAAGVTENPSSHPITVTDTEVGNVSEEVAALARAGRKIEAIKMLREQRGIGLKEAKELVDGVNGEGQGGCLSVLALFMLMTVLLLGS